MQEFLSKAKAQKSQKLDEDFGIEVHHLLMKKYGWIPLKEFEELLQEMSFGFPKDRGIAIATVSYIDKIIEKKLRVFLNKGNKNVQKTLFEKNGAFSTLSLKIDFLYCLGVILPQIYFDLNLLRKIRNEFAHGKPLLDFDDEKIKNRIEELNSYKLIKNNLSQFKITDFIIDYVVFVLFTISAIFGCSI